MPSHARGARETPAPFQTASTWQSPWSCRCRRKAEGCVDHFYEGSLLAKNELLALCHCEIRPRFPIRPQARSVGLVRRKAIECNQTPSHIIRAFVWKKIADQVATASRNDAAPIFGILLELLSLERINLVSDEAGVDRHVRPPGGLCGGRISTAKNQGCTGRYDTLNCRAAAYPPAEVSLRCI